MNGKRRLAPGVINFYAQTVARTPKKINPTMKYLFEIAPTIAAEIDKRMLAELSWDCLIDDVKKRRQVKAHESD